MGGEECRERERDEGGKRGRERGRNHQEGRYLARLPPRLGWGGGGRRRGSNTHRWISCSEASWPVSRPGVRGEMISSE